MKLTTLSLLLLATLGAGMSPARGDDPYRWQAAPGEQLQRS